MPHRTLLLLTLALVATQHLSTGSNLVDCTPLRPLQDGSYVASDPVHLHSQRPWPNGGLIVQEPQSAGISSQQYAFSNEQTSPRDYSDNRDATSDEENSLHAQCRQSLDELPNTHTPRPEPQLFHTSSSAPENSTWRLWYRTPAKSIERDGFLIGNGRTQVLVGGAINVERLVLNEESCWSGGPGEFKKSKVGSDDEGDGDEEGGHEDEYRGGNVSEEEAAQRQESLREFRKALKEKQVIKPSTEIVKSLLGDERGFGRPEAVGEVLIEEMRPFEKVERYTRVLDLETGVVRVSFSVGAVEYTR